METLNMLNEEEFMKRQTSIIQELTLKHLPHSSLPCMNAQ